MKSARIPAKKLLASGPKSLAAGHIANFQTSPSQTLTGQDFYSGDECPSNPTAIYTVAYKVYAVHNLDDNTDYYLVEQEGMYPFENLCAPTYK